MTRDWLLTLLAVMSPYLLAAAITVLALIWRLVQGGRVRRVATASEPRRPFGTSPGGPRER